MFSLYCSNYYNKSANTAVHLQNPSIGDFCVARFSEDNLWYRARVVLIRGRLQFGWINNEQRQYFFILMQKNPY